MNSTTSSVDRSKTDANYRRLARHVAYCDALEKGQGALGETRESVMCLVQAFADIVISWSEKGGSVANPLRILRSQNAFPEYVWAFHDCDKICRTCVASAVNADFIWAVEGGFITADDPSRDEALSYFYCGESCLDETKALMVEFGATLVTGNIFYIPKDEVVLLSLYGEEVEEVNEKQLYLALRDHHLLPEEELRILDQRDTEQDRPVTPDHVL